ncbi:hypothetical protein OIV83_004501 [Microbotryomycetes sp. JL201]|nr:hypothetical protein OIV83_004501 [Microbotryomycetes sp. JL201]
MPRTIQLPTHTSSGGRIASSGPTGGPGGASGPGGGGGLLAHVCVRVNKRLVVAVAVTLVVVLALSRATPLPGAPGSAHGHGSSNLHGGAHAATNDNVDKNHKAQQPGTDSKHDVNSDDAQKLARAVMANGGQPSLTEYLDSHFPVSTHTGQSSTHVWLTLSDGHWMTTGTHALHTFAQRLNRERRAVYSNTQTRDTALVALCIDEQCVRNAEERGMYAYGGFQFTRPEKVSRVETPPPPSSRNARADLVRPMRRFSLIESTKHRDVFFVDSDVSFRYDPYPHMEPFMKTHDIVAQENDAFDHFNTGEFHLIVLFSVEPVTESKETTGWIWMRKSDVTSAAWDKVLKMDMETVSRDQNNFNTVLGTTEQRHCDPKDCERKGSQYPLKSDFVAKNGLKVKVLDTRIFRSYHFESDLPNAQRHDSVSLHMTCGDDAFVKAYVAKAQGFWSNVRNYYDDPPMLITLDHMIGTRNELTRMVKLALMAAHYTNRAFLPPTHASFTDLPKLDSNKEPTTSSRRSFSAFPLSHVEQFLDVKVVEPLYDVHSSQYLFGSSALGPDKVRQDEGWSAKSDEERIRVGLSLHDAAELDMRQIDSFATLYDTLTSDTFRHHRKIKLVHFDLNPNDRAWLSFPLSKHLDGFETCYDVQDRPSCDSICRFPDRQDKRIKSDQGWESLEQITKTSREFARKVALERQRGQSTKFKDVQEQQQQQGDEMREKEVVEFELEEDDVDESDSSRGYVVNKLGNDHKLDKPLKAGGLADDRDGPVRGGGRLRRPVVDDDKDDREAQFHARGLGEQ